MMESKQDIGEKIKAGDNGRFDSVILEDFMNRFYGYGSYQGDYWLVGMEEGGGNSFADVERRLNIWKERGRRELEDVAEYHIDLGVTSLFSERPKIQRTWGKLIRIILTINGYVPTTEQIREYQHDGLGRITGDNCLLELLPLPSPSTRDWLYSEYSRLPYLANRTLYREALLDKRINHLQHRIKKYQPKIVLFYSFTYQEQWQEITNVDFLPVESGDFSMAKSGSQIFVMTKHPATKGLDNEYWHRVGHAIAAQLVARKS